MRLDDPLTPLQVSEVQKLVNQAMGKPFVLIFRASEIQEIRAEGENVSRDGNLTLPHINYGRLKAPELFLSWVSTL
jgi:hypothetical protein